MVACLLVSHGQIATAMLDAGQKIVGHCEQVRALSAEDVNPRQLYQRITETIEQLNCEDGLFILVSLRGGSFWNISAKVARDFPKVEVISGLNLPMVLSFITKHEKYPFKELGEVMIHDSMRGIAKFILQ